MAMESLDGSMLPCHETPNKILHATDMRLPLKPEFIAKLGTVHGNLSLTLPLAIMLFLCPVFCLFAAYLLQTTVYCTLFKLNITLITD